MKSIKEYDISEIKRVNDFLFGFSILSPIFILIYLCFFHLFNDYYFIILIDMGLCTFLNIIMFIYQVYLKKLRRTEYDFFSKCMFINVAYMICLSFAGFLILFVILVNNELDDLLVISNTIYAIICCIILIVMSHFIKKRY